MNRTMFLIAHPSQEVAELLRDELESKFSAESEAVVIDIVRDGQDAIKHVLAHDEKPYRLILIHLGLPYDRKSPRDDKALGGLMLVETLATKLASATPVILITPIENAEIFRRLKRLQSMTCELVAEDLALIPTVTNIVGEILANRGLPEKRLLALY